MLEVTGLRSGYGRIEILHGISLEVASGSVVGLFGRNGAGKTTLVNTIMGLLRPSAGNIHWDGEDLGKMRTEEIVKSGVSLVPQSRGLFMDQSVEENLVLSCIAWPLSRAEEQNRIDEVYDRFPGLSDRSHLKAGSLSGGEQQMLAIGKALVRRPNMLILDEPSMGLAPQVLNEIGAIVHQLRTSDITVLIAEQNVRWTLPMIDRSYVVDQGKVIDEVAVDDSDADEILSSYLGA